MVGLGNRPSLAVEEACRIEVVDPSCRAIASFLVVGSLPLVAVHNLVDRIAVVASVGRNLVATSCLAVRNPSVVVSHTFLAAVAS